MNTNCVFSVIGGDMRQAKLIQMLAADGFCVNICGFENCEEPFNNVVICSDIETCVKYSDCIILGLPFSTDNKLISAPYAENLLHLNELYTCLNNAHLLLGGKLNEDVYIAANKYGFKAVDYFEREELMIENAVPTAEGTIQILMEELPITIQDSDCLITGYGRTGRILGKKLYMLGANVTVAARSCQSRAWITTEGLTAASLENIDFEKNKYDAIINTVPHLIFSDNILNTIDKDTLMIDLASKPGGIDFTAAAAKNLKVIWALSLPGKVAPLTSGKIIKRAIFNIIEGEKLNEPK